MRRAFEAFVASIVILLGWPALVLAESKVTYVGEGRYACRGSTAECAQIDRDNRREAKYRERQYGREQDRAQSTVDRSRWEYEERSNQQRK